MSETLFFDWPTARMAGADGHQVRRKEWQSWKWLHWYNGLWWLKMATYDVGHVVKADEFGRDEFLAQDWTNLPASCITTIQQQTGTGCPKIYNPTNKINGGGGGWINGGGGGGGGDGGGGDGGGGSDNGGDNGGGFLTEGPSGPPPSGTGSGGGGGRGKGGGKKEKPPRNSVQWPTITLTLTDTSPECYERDPSSPIRNASYMAEVTMSTTDDTAAGKPAAGVYMVSVRFGGKSVGVGTITPGGTKTWELNNVAKGNPGLSTFTFEARASLPGKNSGDIIASKSVTMNNWCEYELQFWCDTGFGCHEGVGWVKVTSPTAGEIYNGCPGQGALGLGTGTVIDAGTTVSVQYSNESGPCPGGHFCDAAVFRVEVANGSGHAYLGQANLNNGNDGGDRGPFTFTITQAILDSLHSP